MSNLKRDEIIKMVSDIITHDRQSEYGDPEDNFTCIMRLWNNYIFHKKGPIYENLFTRKDVAILMMLLKIARMTSSPNHLDNYVDAAGYSIIAGSFCDIEDKK